MSDTFAPMRVKSCVQESSVRRLCTPNFTVIGARMGYGTFLKVMSLADSDTIFRVYE